MAQKLIARRARHDEVTGGEILVGLAWGVLYVALIASGWAGDTLMLLADRSLHSLF